LALVFAFRARACARDFFGPRLADFFALRVTDRFAPFAFFDFLAFFAISFLHKSISPTPRDPSRLDPDEVLASVQSHCDLPKPLTFGNVPTEYLGYTYASSQSRARSIW
jgi:hypothetical protein